MKLRVPLLLCALGALAALLVWRFAPPLPSSRREALVPVLREELARVRAARQLAQARDEEAANQDLPGAEFEEAPPATSKREAAPLKLEYRVAGSIVGHQGRRVSRAQILVRKQPAAGKRGGFRFTTAAGRDGSFDLRVPGPGRYQLWSVAGRGPSDRSRADSSQVETLILSKARPRAEVTLVLGPNLAIEGRLLTAEGQPLAAATLIATLDPATRRDAELRLFPDERRFRAARARSAPDGSFRIFPLHPDTPPLRLEVQLGPQHLEQILGPGPRGRDSTLGTYLIHDVAAGTSDLELRIDATLLLGASLTVELNFRCGGPAPPGIGFALTRLDEEGTRTKPLRGQRVLDEQARFTLQGLEVGKRYELQLVDGRYNRGARFGPFRAARGGQLASVVLDAATAVRFEALAPGGAKRGDAVFRVEPLAAASGDGQRKAGKRRAGKCPGGRARLGPGRYLVRATWKRFSAERVFEVAREELVVVLQLEPREAR